MNDALARELLGKVLGWPEPDTATNLEESSDLVQLQHLARYKERGGDRCTP